MSESLTSTQRQIPNAFPLMLLQFGCDAVPASQTDKQLPVSGKGDVIPSYWANGYCMPWAGTIVGISYQLSAAATAGTLTVGPTVNGTEQADPTLSITTGTSGSDTASRGLATFAAGDLVGAEITTSAGWDGTASDLAVFVWVLMELTGI